MKNTVFFFLLSVVLLGWATVQCGSSDNATGVLPGTGGGANAACPTAGNRPATGDLCTNTSLVCPYTAGGGNAETCSCLLASGQGVWVCVATPGAATCPTAANRPATGDRCTNTALVCPYTTGGGAAETCSCVNAGGGQSQWDCVPTGAATCPSTANRPATGDRCTNTALVCPYTTGGGRSTTCDCTTVAGQTVWFCAPSGSGAGGSTGAGGTTGAGGAVGPVCPASMPAAGSACTGGLTCPYNNNANRCTCGGTGTWSCV